MREWNGASFLGLRQFSEFVLVLEVKFIQFVDISVQDYV